MSVVVQRGCCGDVSVLCGLFQRREEAAKAEQSTMFNNEPSQVDPSAASYANVYQAC